MYKLIFFVPVDACEPVKEALFAIGAGKQGDYEHCCWQTLGQGQFRPVGAANPFIGVVGELERVDEWRVEMLCDDRIVSKAIDTLKKAHPYEEVAFDLIELANPPV